MTTQSQYQLYKNYFWTPQDQIGIGGFSTVYKAKELNSGTHVAVKVFVDNYCDLAQEAKLLQRINHRNIIKVVDDGTNEEKTKLQCVVVEYCNGGDLYNILQQPEYRFGLPQFEFLLFLKQITDGMIELHKNQKLAHRDIKPTNILLHIDLNGEHVYKIADLGFAKAINGIGGALLTSPCGTVPYAHPLVLRNMITGEAKSYKANVDLWSLAVTLFQVATSRLPFESKQDQTYDMGNEQRELLKVFSERGKDAICSVYNEETNKYDYYTKMYENCLLSSELREMLEKLIRTLFNSRDNDDFVVFFKKSKKITSLKFVHVISLCDNSLFQVALQPTKKLGDLKAGIERHTGIPMASQILIANNVLLESSVGQKSPISEYLFKMDEKNPILVLDLGSGDDEVKIGDIKEFKPTKQHRPTMQFNHEWAVYFFSQVVKELYALKRSLLTNMTIAETLKGSVFVLREHMKKMIDNKRKKIEGISEQVGFYDEKAKEVDRIYRCICKKGMVLANKGRVKMMEHHQDVDYMSTKLAALDVLFLAIAKKDHQFARLVSQFENAIQQAEQSKRSVVSFEDNNHANIVYDQTVTFYNNDLRKHLHAFYKDCKDWLTGISEIYVEMLDIDQRMRQLEKNIENMKRNTDVEIKERLGSVVNYLHGLHDDSVNELHEFLNCLND